jgi:HEAT repeat protein
MGGITSDELLLFLDVISQPTKDYDVALGLWECDFSHIAFYVVEEEEVLDYRVPDVPTEFVDYDEKLKQLILREKIDIDAVIIPDLKPDEVKNLMNNITAEEKAAILPLVIKTLTDFLSTERAKEVIDGLIELLETCVNDHDFYNARRIAYKLKDYPEVSFVERFENATTIMGFKEMVNIPQNELFNEFLAFIGFFSKKSVPYLLQLLSFAERPDRVHSVRHRIAYIAQDDVTPIAELLQSEDVESIINATAIIGIMRSQDAAKLLEPFINHPDERLRLEIIDALGNVKQPELLVTYVKDPRMEVRIKALRMLAKLKYPQMYPVLLDKIKDKTFLNLEFNEQREYFNYLTANADSNLVPILKNMLFKRKWFGRKKYRVMRRLAASALAQIGSSESLEVLKAGEKKRNKDIQAACELALKGTTQ